MKSRLLLLLVAALAGCATLAPVAPRGPGDGRAAPPAVVPTTAAPAKPRNDAAGAPRLFMPATGGAPIFGIPYGPNLFLPVTGGAPRVGTPFGN